VHVGPPCVDWPRDSSLLIVLTYTKQVLSVLKVRIVLSVCYYTVVEVSALNVVQYMTDEAKNCLLFSCFGKTLVLSWFCYHFGFIIFSEFPFRLQFRDFFCFR